MKPCFNFQKRIARLLILTWIFFFSSFKFHLPCPSMVAKHAIQRTSSSPSWTKYIILSWLKCLPMVVDFSIMPDHYGFHCFPHVLSIAPGTSPLVHCIVNPMYFENTGDLGGDAEDKIQRISMTLPKSPVYFWRGHFEWPGTPQTHNFTNVSKSLKFWLSQYKKYNNLIKIRNSVQ